MNKGLHGGLDSLVNEIDKSQRNVSTLSKSKLDWNSFTKDTKIDEKLKQNRKDGVLSKELFKQKAILNEKSGKLIELPKPAI